MSIDATVWDVTRHKGQLKLWLKDREPGGCAGQASLTVIGPCGCAELLVGRDIWAGGDGPIMCDDMMIGKRITAASCVLFNRPIRDVSDSN